MDEKVTITNGHLSPALLTSIACSEGAAIEKNKDLTNYQNASLLTSDTIGALKEVLLNQELSQKLQLVQNVAQVMRDVQVLQTEMRNSQEEIRRLGAENAGLKKELGVHVMNYSLDNVKNSLEGYDQSNKAHVVAFYAYFSNNFKFLLAGQTFVFDSVETNLGNGYNRKTGIFTAPTGGVYAFTWTIVAAGTHAAGTSGPYGETTAQLRQNGAPRGSVKVDSEKEHDDEVSTGFVVLSVRAGDEIQIVTPGTGEGSFYSNFRNARTSFAGFLLK